MKKNEKNIILAQAWLDYDDSIVKINETNLLNLEFKKEQKKIFCENETEALKHKDLKESVRFLIGLNSINYQFWDLVNNKMVRYSNKGQIGALGSFEGFVEMFDILSKNQFNTSLINENLLMQCFENIPDKEKRIVILKESMDVDNFEKVFELINLHIENQSINITLAQKIVEILPVSYKDPYLKKVQLALYEISDVFKNHGINKECDITVAADYQLPKVLEGLGILEYNKDLMKKIDNFELIEEGSREEKSLRAATIIACENISYTHKISIPALDRVLWLARNNFKNKNFHLTKTSNY